MYQHIKVPALGSKITVNPDFSLNVPNNPIIPYIEGDGTGFDITPVMIKVVDVYPPSADYPDGYALNIAHGLLRMRFRNAFEEPEIMEPGKVYRVQIVSFPMSNRFAMGHRIRVEIAGSNFPHFDINPNTDWQVEGLAHDAVDDGSGHATADLGGTGNRALRRQTGRSQAVARSRAAFPVLRRASR